MPGGVPGYEVVSWYGVLGPAGLPTAVVKRLNDAITAVMTTETMRARLAAEGVDVLSSTPAQFAEYVRVERDKWGTIVRRAGIRAD